MSIAEAFPMSSLARVACSHCGSVVPLGLVEDRAERHFCCDGCRTVFNLLHSSGLAGYYSLRDEARPARSTGRAYEELDDPAFLRVHATPLASGLLRTEMSLEGIHCAACLWLVERLSLACPGVVESRLDFRAARVSLTWDPTRTTLSRAARALDSLGYPSRPARDGSDREARRRDDRRHLVRLAIAGAAAGNSMLVAFALYAGMFDPMDGAHAALFRWLSMGIGLVSLLGPGMVFFRGALAAVRTRTASLDLAIALGLGVGGFWGTVNTIRGTGEIYFDSLSVLVFLLLVGRWLQARQQRGAADSVELLFSLTPSSASLVRDGGVARVPVEALVPGDVVEVLAGESIPADGVVTSGQSEIDASLLTGESRPAAVSPGSAVAAGTVNLAATLRVRTEVAGEQTRVGRLMRLVEEGARRRAPIVRLADRIAGRFVAGVVVAALATFVAWLFIEPALAPEQMAALLIVTCPCALGMATPLAMTVAIGRAARRGILVKGADALQSLSRPGTLVLDKTGTLTMGRLSLREFTGDPEALSLAAALERGSSHPIARAILEACPDGAGLPPATDVRQTLGSGIEGIVGKTRVTVGSPAFVSQDRPLAPNLSAALKRSLDATATPVAISIDGDVRALASLADSPRPGTSEAIRRLREAGWVVEVLSGDHPEIVAHIARELCLPSEAARGGASPLDKVEHVRTRRSPVVMVGDGVNDAPALAAADVGIAVHAGAEASLAAADVYLSTPGIAPIVDLVDAATRTMRTIRLGFTVSILYNAFAGSLAVVGMINPLLAAVLMPLSSFSVLAIATRAKTFGGPRWR